MDRSPLPSSGAPAVGTRARGLPGQGSAEASSSRDPLRPPVVPGGWDPGQGLCAHQPQEDAHKLAAFIICQQIPATGPEGTPAFTWVRDRLDDVPVPPLGLHALQLLGLIPPAALLLLLLPGILWGQTDTQGSRSGTGRPCFRGHVVRMNDKTTERGKVSGRPTPAREYILPGIMFTPMWT